MKNIECHSVGKRIDGDSRITLLRLRTKDYIYNKGFSVSFSLHPYLFKFNKNFHDFRLTCLGFNLHYSYN